MIIIKFTQIWDYYVYHNCTPPAASSLSYAEIRARDSTLSYSTKLTILSAWFRHIALGLRMVRVTFNKILIRDSFNT